MLFGVADNCEGSSVTAACPSGGLALFAEVFDFGAVAAAVAEVGETAAMEDVAAVEGSDVEMAGTKLGLGEEVSLSANAATAPATSTRPITATIPIMSLWCILS